MDGGPPVFPRDSSCPAVLRIPAAPFRFQIRGSHPLWPAFPCRSSSFQSRDAGPYPEKPCGPSVWPSPLSLATTRGISVDVFSSPYLDVSVQAVPFRNLWIQLRMTAFYAAGFPHSEISGSMRMCRSPELIAACHVLLRLLMPRHSPCALFRLTSSMLTSFTSFPRPAFGLPRKLRITPSHLLSETKRRFVSVKISGSLNYAGSYRIYSSTKLLPIFEFHFCF